MLLECLRSSRTVTLRRLFVRRSQLIDFLPRLKIVITPNSNTVTTTVDKENNPKTTLEEVEKLVYEPQKINSFSYKYSIIDLIHVESNGQSKFVNAGEHRNSDKSDWFIGSPPQITCRLNAKKNSIEKIGTNSANSAKSTHFLSEPSNDPEDVFDSLSLNFCLKKT